MTVFTKERVLKAVFGALYASIAEVTIIQLIDQNTLYVALIGAGLRFCISLLSDLKDMPVSGARFAKMANKMKKWVLFKQWLGKHC